MIDGITIHDVIQHGGGSAVCGLIQMQCEQPFAVVFHSPRSSGLQMRRSSFILGLTLTRRRRDLIPGLNVLSVLIYVVLARAATKNAPLGERLPAQGTAVISTAQREREYVHSREHNCIASEHQQLRVLNKDFV